MRVDVPHACGINVTEMMYLEGLCRLLDTVLSNCTASPKYLVMPLMPCMYGFSFLIFRRIVKVNCCFTSETKWLPYNPPKCVAFSQVNILLYSRR